LVIVTTNKTTTKAFPSRTYPQKAVFCFPTRSAQHTQEKQCQHKLEFSTESVERLKTLETTENLSCEARKPPALLLVINKITVWNKGARTFKKVLEDEN
jgi:hypothetical protein